MAIIGIDLGISTSAQPSCAMASPLRNMNSLGGKTGTVFAKICKAVRGISND